MDAALGRRYKTILAENPSLATLQRRFVCSDTTPDKGGGGDCLRLHDLLCAGFASCLNITIRMLLDRMSLQYDKVITKVDINRDVPDNATFLYDVMKKPRHIKLFLLKLDAAGTRPASKTSPLLTTAKRW